MLPLRRASSSSGAAHAVHSAVRSWRCQGSNGDRLMYFSLCRRKLVRQPFRSGKGRGSLFAQKGLSFLLAASWLSACCRRRASDNHRPAQTTRWLHTARCRRKRNPTRIFRFTAPNRSAVPSFVGSPEACPEISQRSRLCLGVFVSRHL